MKRIFAVLMLIVAVTAFAGCAKHAEQTTVETTSRRNDETTSPCETESVPASFSACSISLSSGEMKYWLYTPSDPTDHMPLIVYLHGGSGKGDNLALITDADGFPKYLQDGRLGDVRAYVIIPQLPSSQKGWSDSADSVYGLIQETVSEFHIDRGNISLTGHSMGGTGTWSLALTYPQLFARIAPLSGSIRERPGDAEKLKNLSVRAFVGSADVTVPPESSVNFVAKLKANGGNADITVFDGADHFAVPSLTYLDESIDLVDWLIGVN